MHQSCHEVPLDDGSRCDVYVLADEDFVVFGTEPALGPDLSLLGLRGKRRSIHYRLENGQLWLEAVMGEFRCRLFCALPVIDGVKAVRSCTVERVLRSDDGTVERVLRCENPRMWEYGLRRLSDFTGTMLIGRDFDMRFWPKNEYTEDVPCNPDVYRVVERLGFTAGRLTGRERVK